MPAMTGLVDWLGRVVMLVLAGMITLSIIGAIAAIPSGSIETRLGVERGEWPQPLPAEKAVPPPQAAPPAPTPPAPATSASSETRLAAAAQPKSKPSAAEWLEAITYTLIALAGLAAFGLLLFWRALHHWRRSADALEALAARRT